jgi:CRP/FNR family transcriptional regulator, cyclic AMP receptor protein
VRVRTFDSPWVKDNIGTYGTELGKLLKIGRPRKCRAGRAVYIQGERSRVFYFLRKGRVKISIFREDGSEKILAIQEENTFFGESAAFDDQPYFATATVLEPSEIFQIDRDDLLRSIRETPSIASMISCALIRKMRLLAFQVEDLSFLDAQKRVVHILLTLADELGVRKEDGLHIQKRITHDDLAHLTGLSRVTVTNVLNYLERLNILKKSRCMLTIIDPERLTNLLGVGGGSGKDGSLRPRA